MIKLQNLRNLKRSPRKLHIKPYKLGSTSFSQRMKTTQERVASSHPFSALFYTYIRKNSHTNLTACAMRLYFLSKTPFQTRIRTKINYKASLMQYIVSLKFHTQYIVFIVFFRKRNTIPQH